MGRLNTSLSLVFRLFMGSCVKLKLASKNIGIIRSRKIDQKSDSEKQREEM